MVISIQLSDTTAGGPRLKRNKSASGGCFCCCLIPFYLVVAVDDDDDEGSSALVKSSLFHHPPFGLFRAFCYSIFSAIIDRALASPGPTVQHQFQDFSRQVPAQPIVCLPVQHCGPAIVCSATVVVMLRQTRVYIYIYIPSSNPLSDVTQRNKNKKEFDHFDRFFFFFQDPPPPLGFYLTRFRGIRRALSAFKRSMSRERTTFKRESREAPSRLRL
jgi:hypothetical protein